MMIKNWFLNKNFNYNEKYIIENGNLSIAQETEKAVKIVAISKFGNLVFWCPKSCLETEAERTARSESAFDKYEQLKQFAKENGVKVTARMRKQTLLDRMTTELKKQAVEKGLLTQYEALCL